MKAAKITPSDPARWDDPPRDGPRDELAFAIYHSRMAVEEAQWEAERQERIAANRRSREQQKETRAASQIAAAQRKRENQSAGPTEEDAAFADLP